MLDLARMRRIDLVPRPRFQRVVALLLLAPNYHTPPRVKIEVEGVENIPDEPVIWAMNHTDMYNYWPFQYWLWRKQDRFTSVWVKGKYYEHPLMGRFMEWANTIPAVSRGYLITKDFIQTLGRRPEGDEYRALNEAVKVAGDPDGDLDEVDLSSVPRAILETPRDMLGRAFEPRHEHYAEAVQALLREMNRLFLAHNEDCFRKGLDLIIFPQGTRSKRLPRGKIGLSQIALRYHKTVVPVGCNGSDNAYNSASPVASGANITYRIGEPIRYDDVPEFHIDEPYTPFTPEAEHVHRDAFRGFTDYLMDRINELLDPEYQYAEDLQSDGVAGTARFV